MRPSALTVLVVFAVVMPVGASSAASAAGSTTSEEREGAALTAAVNGGRRACRSLSPDDFDRVGEYAMGLNFTSGAEHEAMNARMTTMMGADGERQAHRAMGRSYSGCAAGARGAAGGGMMGSASSGSGTAGGYGAFGAGMMRGSAYGPATTGALDGGGDGLGTGSVVLVGLAAALLGGGLSAFVLTRRSRVPGAGSQRAQAVVHGDTARGTAEV